MNKTPLLDPFEGLKDDPDQTPADMRKALLKAAKRGYVPLRKEFIQKRRAERDTPRGSVLAEFVTNRRQRPLDAFLLVHALNPIMQDDPLDLWTWARLLSAGSRCTPNAASKCFSVLEEMGLVKREQEGRRTIVRPLMETGETSTAWTRPGEDPDEGGPGFFVIPHAYWTTGLSEKLTMPGKAMFLVLLHDTQSPNSLTFSAALERMALWYGLSERTAERGYRELRAAGVLAEHVQRVSDPRHPTGRRAVHHRALLKPYGTRDRMVLQGKTRTAVRLKAEKAQAAVDATGGEQ